MALFHADYETTENDMPNTNQNTNTNTATAESALLSGDSLAQQFDTAMASYNTESATRQNAQKLESAALMTATKLATLLIAQGAKVADFTWGETDKAGNVTKKAGKHGSHVKDKSQWNKITAVANNKKVQKAVKDATTQAGGKVNMAIVDATFKSKGWTSYKKAYYAVKTIRKVKLDKEQQELSNEWNAFRKTWAIKHKRDISNADDTAINKQIATYVAKSDMVE